MSSIQLGSRSRQRASCDLTDAFLKDFFVLTHRVEGPHHREESRAGHREEPALVRAAQGVSISAVCVSSLGEWVRRLG